MEKIIRLETSKCKIYIIKSKNRALAQAIDLGNKLSKAKSLYSNHHKSTIVKKEILTI